MKITLDLTELVETGKLTAAEAERLRGFAARDTGALGINILVAFGVVAVAGGIGALVPSAATAIALGAVLCLLGFGIRSTRRVMWDLFATIAIVVGTLSFCGGLAVLEDGSLPILLLDVMLLTLAGILARSGLLITLAVLVLSLCLGSSAGYSHALYTLSVEEPTLTIVTFALVALGTYLASLRLRAAYERLALIAARTAVLMVNFGFWVGSLWGDRLVVFRGLLDGGTAGDHSAQDAVALPPMVFIVGWALALLAVGLWAARENRRWIVNTAAVFGAIHFYTQWFERLGANPFTVLLAGVFTLAFAMVFWGYNRRRDGSDESQRYQAARE